MAAKFSDLVSYFEKIAEEHVDIKHTAKKKHFYRFDIDEVISGLCTNLNYPALVLESYDFNYGDSQSDNIMKRRSGAFMLIDKVTDTTDFNKIHEVWDRMEAIGDDILIRMRDDKASRQVPAVRDFAINECEGIQLPGNALGQYGVRITFVLKSPVNSNKDVTRWL